MGSWKMPGSSVEEINEAQAKLIISELVKNSADHFVIAPGSRSTPLVLAAIEDPLAITSVHFDERSAGFYAYGLAKATRKPVCIIVTSGTAVANLTPAIAEAQKDEVPLIIITADRPPELHDCGANQTMKQIGFFSSLVKDEVNIFPDDKKAFMKSLSRRLDQACYQSVRTPMGPVHLNVMIREPFFGNGKKKSKTSYSHPLPETRYHLGEYRLPEEEIEFLAAEFSSIEKGLIIVGQLPNNESADTILALAMKLQWPIFADPASGLRSLGRDTTIIPFYNHILQTTFSKEKMVPETVIYLGAAVVSKPLSAWASALGCSRFYHILNSPHSFDSIHTITNHIEMKVERFCESICKKISARAPSFWLSLWKEYSLHIEEILTSFFSDCDEMNEPFTVFSLIQQTLFDVDLFFSNSLPIRYADSFLFPDQEIGHIYSKRGLSGIDGVLSMAIGVAEGTKRPLICVIGDIALMHDLNALALLKERNLPITLVVLNNGGGGIFHFLPIAIKKDACNEYWVQKHNRKFEKHIIAFDLPYDRINTKDEYEEAMRSVHREEGPRVLEIVSDADANYHFHQEIENHLKKKMMRSKKEKELCYFALEKAR